MLFIFEILQRTTHRKIIQDPMGDKIITLAQGYSRYNPTGYSFLRIVLKYFVYIEGMFLIVVN